MSKPHLLISVFLTPEGLNRYRLGHALDQSDPYFRISRFLTSCMSLARIDWESVAIYFDMNDEWTAEKARLGSLLQKIFPNGKIEPYRLSCRPEWEAAASRYADDSVILLQTNDDHAFVATDDDALDELVEAMGHPTYPLGAVTHFPEMQGMLSRCHRGCSPSRSLHSLEVDYAIGTIMVRADFFKSWWREGSFDDDELVVRPDNPFGRTVGFQAVNMLITRVELLRHMDGYSHIGLYRPLAPLRNLVRYPDLTTVENGAEFWTLGLWPSRCVSYSGSGVDIVATKTGSRKPAQRFRANVGQLQAAWALRLSPLRGGELLDPGTSRLMLLASATVALCTWPLARNVPDWILDLIWRWGSTTADVINHRSLAMPWSVWYLGWSRAMLTRRHRRRMR